jgi:PAS domain S-box-containing protein
MDKTERFDAALDDEGRRAAENLRSSERQFSLLVEGVTDYAIYMLDPEGRVSSWNSGAARIKGYRADEIIGQHFSQFYTEEDRALGLPQQSLDTALREGRFEREGWRVRKDGTRFWANVVIDTIRDDEGRVAGFAKVTRDVTERMNTQKALDEAREALFQSQKLEAIGQLTGGVAHDFNNLLMAILGSLELVRKRVSDDPKVLGLIDNAIQGAQRGASLTQRMLAFARRQELRREAVDLSVLVAGMEDLMARSIGPAISIRTDFPADLPPAETDPNQLESALLNLVVNARDAMPKGGSITISAQATAHPPADLAPGPYLRLTVADTGEGMDPAAASRAMEPFFTTKGVGKGTGLGLSMVQGLAQQSGGKLELASRPGQGTSVHLWLPVSHKPVTDRSDATPAPAPRAVRPLTVLAVDDDELVLRNTAAMLEDLGHTVLQASSGKEALALLRAGATADLMITDQVMPRMTGVQLAAEAMGERPEMKVILATGYAELSPEAGASLPRLAKPFTQDQLRHALADAEQSA